MGAATAVPWPGDIGGQGNAGVANQVQQIPGAIGYVELADAAQNNMAWAQVQNSAGKFLDPALDTAVAASEIPTLPDNMEVLVVNSTNPNAYPIVGFTWAIVYVNMTDAAKADTMAHLLWWMEHDGQRLGTPLDYVAIEGSALGKAENLVRKIMLNGKPVLQ